ncbi:MAG: DNA polymerase IV [Clostridiales bacterium]|nr:DNA polymerase IV [Clostridiales bacterium]
MNGKFTIKDNNIHRGSERAILHVDMNNFFASVECMLDTTLRDKAVAVCGSVEERHGIVLAKNYRAKAYGVKTGEAVWQAKQKCAGLVTVPPHYDRYARFAKLAREIYSRYTDMIEPYGMDECWLDVTGSALMGSGYEIAEEIRRTVKEELGLTVSAGVSFNKVFAKLGSDLKKPDAVTCITRENFREQIWNLPAGELLGVGPATGRTLAKFGIMTIGDLAKAPDEFLQRRLGICGLRLKLCANGMDNSSVLAAESEYPIKSVGHGTTTLQDLENGAQVRCVMLELVQDISSRLAESGKKACSVAIAIRDNNLDWEQHQCPLPMPTRSPSCLAETAWHLFEAKYRIRRPIRSVSVRAINLVDEDIPMQVDFFTDFERIEKREALDRTVELLRGRFGRNIIRSAVLFGDIHMPAHNGVPAVTI